MGKGKNAIYHKKSNQNNGNLALLILNKIDFKSKTSQR